MGNLWEFLYFGRGAHVVSEGSSSFAAMSEMVTRSAS